MPVAPAFPWVQGLAPARREVVMNLGSVYALLKDARRPVENGPRSDQQPLVGSDIPRCSAGRATKFWAWEALVRFQPAERSQERWACSTFQTRLAKLAAAPGLGPGAREGVRVRVSCRVLSVTMCSESSFASAAGGAASGTWWPSSSGRTSGCGPENAGSTPVDHPDLVALDAPSFRSGRNARHHRIVLWFVGTPTVTRLYWDVPCGGSA